MYKIIGADGKQYGPISVDQLREWITQGRVNAQTQVQADGSVEWKPLAQYPELAGLAALGQSGVSRPGLPPSLGGMPVAPPKTSGLAIASLVLGILGLCTMGVTGLIGVILGIVALMKINKSAGALGGKGLAIAGICVSGCMMLLIPIQLAMLLPALAKAKAKAQTINCINNIKQLNLALLMYANDNQDTFPNANNWCTAIQSYAVQPSVFVCPAKRSLKAPQSTYFYNARLSGLKQDKVNPSTVLIFECDGEGWNKGGTRSNAATHHGGIYTVGLADGSARQVTASGLQQLRWDP